ncbi:MAG: hypothetical protein KF819_19635 [Labilithrix sp.]|nr:hypothetical protein [Labilithrix sp.]
MSAAVLKEIHEDKRGAVMLTGLCMSCFLIGCLWFLIGIGDAIVFRDTMQEATDHAAFTSAVIHAKGMNFISACNLILLALIAIHILMGMIHDILLAYCILFAVPTLGAACIPYARWRPIYTGYGRIFKPIAAAIHLAEVVASYGYPYVGAYKGYTLGNDYGNFGPKKHDMWMATLSPSMLPGGIMDGLLNKAFTRKGKGPVGADGKPTDDKSFTNSGASKKGLPVAAKKYSEVCDKIGKMGIDALLSLTGNSNLGKGGVMGMVKKIIGGILKFRYCNDLGSDIPDLAGSMKEANGEIDKANTQIDTNNANLPEGGKAADKIGNIDIGAGAGGGSCWKDNSVIDPGLDKWWGCDGPLLPWGGTSNGSPWNQVWAVNFRPSFTDDQEHAVAIGQRKMGQRSTATPNTYFAEAEFYFDCTGKWSDQGCNFEDNAGYSIQWRARLKRLEFPEIGTLISSFAGQFLGNLKAYKDFQKAVKDKGRELIDNLGVGNALSAIGLNAAIDEAFKNLVTSPIQKGINQAGGFFDPTLVGPYH